MNHGVKTLIECDCCINIEIVRSSKKKAFTLVEVMMALAIGSFFIMTALQLLVTQKNAFYSIIANFRLSTDMRHLSNSLRRDIRSQKGDAPIVYCNDGGWRVAEEDESGEQLRLTLANGDSVTYSLKTATINNVDCNQLVRALIAGVDGNKYEEVLAFSVEVQPTNPDCTNLFAYHVDQSLVSLWVSAKLLRPGRRGKMQYRNFQMFFPHVLN